MQNFRNPHWAQFVSRSTDRIQCATAPGETVRKLVHCVDSCVVTGNVSRTSGTHRHINWIWTSGRSFLGVAKRIETRGVGKFRDDSTGQTTATGARPEAAKSCGGVLLLDLEFSDCSLVVLGCQLWRNLCPHKQGDKCAVHNLNKLQREPYSSYLQFLFLVEFPLRSTESSVGCSSSH